MESLLCRQDTRTTRMEGGQLQRVLIGLGTAVDQEQAVVLVAACLAQALGQLLLKLIDDGVTVKAKLFHLTAHGLHIVWMSVADADDGMTSIKIQILSALVVPHAATLATHDIDGEKGIDVEKCHYDLRYDDLLFKG